MNTFYSVNRGPTPRHAPWREPARPSSPTRRLVAGVTALAAAGLLAACAANSTAAGGLDIRVGGPPDISVADAGSGPTVELPVAYEIGQTASATSEFSSSIDIEGGGIDEAITFSFRLDLSSSVTEADPEGGGLVTSVVDVFEWIEEPAVDIDASLEDLVGVGYTEEVDASGTVVSRELVDDGDLTSEQQQLANDYLIEQTTVAFSFPDEPVGVGATWSADTSVESNGIELPVTYQYQLVALDEESYGIDVTYDSPIDTEAAGVDLGGRISGSGSITGARDNPLDVAYSFEQVANVDAEQGGQSISMDMEIAIDNQITASSASEGATDGSTGSSPTG